MGNIRSLAPHFNLYNRKDYLKPTAQGEVEKQGAHSVCTQHKAIIHCYFLCWCFIYPLTFCYWWCWGTQKRIRHSCPFRKTTVTKWRPYVRHGHLLGTRHWASPQCRHKDSFLQPSTHSQCSTWMSQLLTSLYKCCAFFHTQKIFYPTAFSPFTVKIMINSFWNCMEWNRDRKRDLPLSHYKGKNEKETNWGSTPMSP